MISAVVYCIDQHHTSIDLSHASVHKELYLFSTSLASNPLHAIQKQFYHFSAILFPPTFAQIDTPSPGFLKKLPLAMFIFTKWNMCVPKRYLWKKICNSTSCNHMCLFNKPPIYSKTTLRNRWPSRIVAANSSHAINLTRCRHRGWEKICDFGVVDAILLMDKHLHQLC